MFTPYKQYPGKKISMIGCFFIIGLFPFVAPAQTRFLDDYRPKPAYAWQTRAPLADQSPRLIITTLTSDVQGPFAMAFLPDNKLLISEKPGQMRILDANGKLSEPIDGLPEIWVFRGNGLGDVVLDPDFEKNRLIYFSYAALPEGDHSGLSDEEKNALALAHTARARLTKDGKRLERLKILIETGARRIVFAADGTLFLTTTAAMDSRDFAQDMGRVEGKVLRINPDGSIPKDNPYIGQKGIHPAIYANGFRDPSGAAIHPQSGELWTVEHGPRGGDEINIIKPGRNYGWPTITYGREYNQEFIGEGLTQKQGMEQPRYYWVPSIAPSSLMFYTGDLIKAWQGSAFVTTLSGEHISRLVLVGDNIVAEERLLSGRQQRLRSVSQGPDGALYVLTNGNPGEASHILKLTPKPLPKR